MFPLKNYKYNLPEDHEPGSFGFVRKYDIHTGVDLYCEELDPVYAIEDGTIVNVAPFTGAGAESPWWEDTSYITVEGDSGVILYGELSPSESLFHNLTELMDENIKKGQLLGYVKRVLKSDKKVVPSTCMLHMELYKKGTKEPVWWKLGEPKPEELLNVNDILKKLI